MGLGRALEVEKSPRDERQENAATVFWGAGNGSGEAAQVRLRGTGKRAAAGDHSYITAA